MMDEKLKSKLIQRVRENPAASETKKILDELASMKKLLYEIRKGQSEYDLSEVSLNRAKKLLNAGDETVKDYIKRGYLKARRYRDGSGRMRYKIRLSDIKRFQEEQHAMLMREPPPVQYESAEDIFNRCRIKVLGAAKPTTKRNKQKKEALCH